MTNARFGRITRWIVQALVVAVAVLNSASADTPVDYLRDVKPIFIKHCSSCHGGLKQNGGLRLDTVASILRGGESGAGIEPGRVERSLILQVLRGEAGFTMPPANEGTAPTPDQVALIEAWVRDGAKAPAGEQPQADPKTWWSYQPLTDVVVPTVRDTGWVRNEVDAFIAAGHEIRNLTPQAAARPEVLLRRLYLDLIGIPPTPEELNAFVSDPSDAAFEAIVDDLLARPQYGERWGRHWMDVWRYSDQYGHRPSNEIGYRQHIWRWREWIVRSLNEDKGYDRLLVEMLAGDEVAPTDNDVLAATGFLGRNGYGDDRNTSLFETVEQTSRGFMAMTMQCCRCHDHKYDPVSQREYYQFRAFFEPHAIRTDALQSAMTTTDRSKASVRLDGLARAFDEDPEVATYLFRRGDDGDPDEDNPLQPQVPATFGRDDLNIQAVTLPPEAYMPQLSDAALQRAIATGEAAVANANEERDTILAHIDRLQERINKFDDAAETVDTEPFINEEFESIDTTRWKVVGGRWETKDGRLIQSKVRRFATMVSIENHPRNFIAKARYRTLKAGQFRSVGFSFDSVNGGTDSHDVYTSRSGSNRMGSVQAFHRKGGRHFYPQAGIREADFQVGEWIDLEFEVRETNLTVRLNGDVKLEYRLPMDRVDGKFSIWVHTGTAEFERLSVRPVVATVPDLENAIRAAQHQLRLAELAVDVAKAQLEFQTHQVLADRHRLGTRTPTAESPAAVASRSERRLHMLKAKVDLVTALRVLSLANNPDSREKVQNAHANVRAAEEALAQPGEQYTHLESAFPPTSTGRRLALARWLTRADHPRTARVAVNHIWMRHMGRPIVATVDNFGLSGSEPTHPGLLDWLSSHLVANSWSMKHLHKLIVMSNTYRLSSRTTRNGKNRWIDRSNRYLWRAHTKRMEAEVIRDSLLAVSGELDSTMGGPDLDDTHRQTSHRRSIYFRTERDSQMRMRSLLDQAHPNECHRQRESIIPSQAPALMNGRLAIDLSRQLAAKLTKEVPPDTENADAAFIRLAFQTVLSRNATNEDIVDCRGFLRDTAKFLLQSDRKAVSEAIVPPSSDPRQRARERLIHVLFHHNDFITIR